MGRQQIGVHCTLARNFDRVRKHHHQGDVAFRHLLRCAREASSPCTRVNGAACQWPPDPFRPRSASPVRPYQCALRDRRVQRAYDGRGVGEGGVDASPPRARLHPGDSPPLRRPYWRGPPAVEDAGRGRHLPRGRAGMEPLPSTVEPLPSTVEPLPSTVDPLPSTVEPLPSTVEPLTALPQLKMTAVVATYLEAAQ
eukprot:1177932-Prorocentrum_minimum.AAC.1